MTRGLEPAMHRHWIVERLAAVLGAAVLAVGSRGTLAQVTQGGPLLWAEFGVSVAVESGTVLVEEKRGAWRRHGPPVRAPPVSLG